MSATSLATSFTSFFRFLTLSGVVGSSCDAHARPREVEEGDASIKLLHCATHLAEGASFPFLHAMHHSCCHNMLSHMPDLHSPQDDEPTFTAVLGVLGVP